LNVTINSPNIIVDGIAEIENKSLPSILSSSEFKYKIPSKKIISDELAD